MDNVFYGRVLGVWCDPMSGIVRGLNVPLFPVLGHVPYDPVV